MRAGVPIVPIAIVGNDEAMPILAKSKLLARLLNVPYAPLTANMLVFGPIGGLVMPLPVKFRLRVLPHRRRCSSVGSNSRSVPCAARRTATRNCWSRR